MFDFDEDHEKCDEQVEDNRVAIPKARKWPISKGCSSTPLSQDNCNEGMQLILRVNEERRPLEEQRYPTRERQPLGQW